MNKDNEVRAYTKAMGKEAGRALAFFFLGIPALLAVLVLTLMFGFAFFIPASLGLLAVVVVWKYLSARA